MRKRARWSDIFPSTLIGLALFCQFLILGFLTILSLGNTVILARKHTLVMDKWGAYVQEFGAGQIVERDIFLHGMPSLWLIFGIVLLLIGFMACAQFLQRVNSRTIHKVLLVYVGVAGLVWILSLNMVQYSFPDTNSLVAAADAITNHSVAAFDPSACEGSKAFAYCQSDVPSLYNYFHYYPFQAGPAWWFTLIFALFGSNNFIAFQTVNVVFMVLTVASLWSLGKQLGLDKRGECAFALVCATCVPMLMVSALVYTNVVGFSLVLIGVSLLVKSISIHNPWWCAAAMTGSFLICALGVMFKSTYIIVILAVLLGVIFASWRSTRFWQIPVALVATVVIDKISIIPVRALEHWSGQNFGKGMPMSAWIAIGLNSPNTPSLVWEGVRADGWWSGIAIHWFHQTDGDYAKQSALASEFIHARFADFMADPQTAWNFFHEKLVSEWADPTFQTAYYSELGHSGTQFSGAVASLLGQGWPSAFFRFQNVWMSLVYLLACVAAIVLTISVVRKGWSDWSSERIFSTVTLCAGFIGGFLCYVLWEAKSIYTFPFFLLLLPLAAYGIQAIAGALRSLWKQRSVGKTMIAEDTTMKSSVDED